MRRERDFAGTGSAARKVIQGEGGLISRAAELLKSRGASRASTPDALPLTSDERRHYTEADFVVDAEGAETLRGLSRLESLEYIALHRIGLDNDDDAFLRLILLGDRHAATMRLIDRR